MIDELQLFIPRPDDGWFYVKMMSDSETMAYNAQVIKFYLHMGYIAIIAHPLYLCDMSHTIYRRFR